MKRSSLEARMPDRVAVSYVVLNTWAKANGYRVIVVKEK